MKVLLTQRENITSKKTGDKFVIYRGLSNSGNTVELFLNEVDADKYAIPVSKILPAEALEEMFADDKHLVDVVYNQRGRVESVQVL